MEENNRLLLRERAEELALKYIIEVTTKSGFFVIVEEGPDALYTETGADLVVMGMAVRSVEQDIFGNTTTSVILELKYPVLAVPRTAQFKNFNNILFGCEDLKKLDVSVKEMICKMSRQLDAIVEIFHVDETLNEKEGHNTELDDFEDINCFYQNCVANDVIKAIEQEIESVNAKLLIMVPQRHGFWESIFHKSKTRMMASGLSIPLLSIPQ